MLRLLLALTLAVAVFAIATDAGFARVNGQAIGNPTISKVVFAGSAANPGITVEGSDLTYDPYNVTAAPPPSPTYTPGGHPGCPRNFKGPQGTTTASASTWSTSQPARCGRWAATGPESANSTASVL